jgi:hypothetical protein
MDGGRRRLVGEWLMVVGGWSVERLHSARAEPQTLMVEAAACPASPARQQNNNAAGMGDPTRARPGPGRCETPETGARDDDDDGGDDEDEDEDDDEDDGGGGDETMATSDGLWLARAACIATIYLTRHAVARLCSALCPVPLSCCSIRVEYHEYVVVRPFQQCGSRLHSVSRVLAGGWLGRQHTVERLSRLPYSSCSTCSLALCMHVRLQRVLSVARPVLWPRARVYAYMCVVPAQASKPWNASCT